MKSMVIGLALIGLVGCSTLRVATDPAADPGDQVCAVLAWGIPIAESRLGTLGPRGAVALDGAKRVAAAGCLLADANWKARAIAAGIELTNVLWGLTR